MATRTLLYTSSVAALTLLLAGALACGSSDPAPETATAPEPEPAAEPEPAPAQAANTPPRVDSVRFDPDEPTVGDVLRAIVDATDAENDGLSFEYSWEIDGEPAGHGEAELRVTGEKGQSIEVEVVASDGHQKSRPVWGRVEIENRAPVIAGVGVEPVRDVVVGMPVVVHPDASDPDGDRLSYRYEWTVNGRAHREDGPLLETDRLRRGDEVRVRVYAGDGEDESEPFDLPPLVVVNSPPRFTSRPPETLTDGAFSYRVVAEDPDGDLSLEYRLEDAPEGMEIEPYSGVVTWNPTPEQAGTHSVTVVADDLHDGLGRHVFEVRVSSDPEDVPAAPSS